MALLFLDTTYDVFLGVLDDKYSWLGFKQFSGKKASVVIQKETFNLCHELGLKVKDLNGVITIAGAGFYTGLRLSEGFADIFKAFKIPSYNLYSHEIPKLAGVVSGVWVTKAYRGEYLFSYWGDFQKTELVTASDITQKIQAEKIIYIHSQSALDELAIRSLNVSISTAELIQKKPEILEKVVVENWKRESYYFRAPEDEFKVNP